MKTAEEAKQKATENKKEIEIQNKESEEERLLREFNEYFPSLSDDTDEEIEKLGKLKTLPFYPYSKEVITEVRIHIPQKYSWILRKDDESEVEKFQEYLQIKKKLEEHIQKISNNGYKTSLNGSTLTIKLCMIKEK